VSHYFVGEGEIAALDQDTRQNGALFITIAKEMDDKEITLDFYEQLV